MRAMKLRKARALISHPKNWTTDASARDRNGERIWLGSPQAVSFCALGACERVGVGYYDFLKDSVDVLSSGDVNSIAFFNDSHTHDEVLWMFDLAIAFEEVGV